jgi:hypothetical protein
VYCGSLPDESITSEIFKKIGGIEEENTRNRGTVKSSTCPASPKTQVLPK